MAGKAYVCDGAKIECQLCTKPEGELKVTSNEIKIQDKKFANAKDKEKVNLIFQGNCKKSPYQSQPCQAVIKVEDWQGVADALIQDDPALLEDSTIMCTYGGAPIKITDHLQKNEPTSLEPIMAPVVTPAPDPKIVTIDWKEDDNDPKIKGWIEATTLNIMPGEEIRIYLDKKN